MNYYYHNKKAFTITELLVAIALLAGIMVGSGLVFSKAVETQQISSATSEITQKYQAICRQLDTDFGGLRKDGEIFLVWMPVWDPERERYVNFDRIMFFADGSFQSYTNPDLLPGNRARLNYMIARNSEDYRPQDWDSVNGRFYMDKQERILARSQHFYTAEVGLDVFPDMGGWNIDEFQDNEESLEYQTMTMNDWVNLFDTGPGPSPEKSDIMAIITDIILLLDPDTETPYGTIAPADNRPMGTLADLDDISTYHNILAPGISEFKIQAWYEPEQRWFPEVNPDNDVAGDLTDSDFEYDTTDTTKLSGESLGIWYPFGYIGSWSVPTVFPMDSASFDNIPGLGKAFKFTFTIHDSGGVFPDGKTFSHIVYID